MTVGGWGQILLFIVVLGAVALPLGNYMARVYTGETVFLSRAFGGVERRLYRLLRVDERLRMYATRSPCSASRRR